MVVRWGCHITQYGGPHPNPAPEIVALDFHYCDGPTQLKQSIEVHFKVFLGNSPTLKQQGTRITPMEDVIESKHWYLCSDEKKQLSSIHTQLWLADTCVYSRKPVFPKYAPFDISVWNIALQQVTDWPTSRKASMNNSYCITVYPLVWFLPKTLTLICSS